MDLVPFIFHEKQEGQLCCQHALNALLQGSYYTAVDLADLARQLDTEEKSLMGSSTLETSSESQNFDDTGFFSIQVIQKALESWSLELIPFANERTKSSRQDPTTEMAYILNLQEHWFTLRRFSKRWYNLNSLLKVPEWTSETYLMRGSFPSSEADLIAESLPVVPPQHLQKVPADNLIQDAGSSSTNVQELSSVEDDDEDGLRWAMEESLKTSDSGPVPTDEDNDLQAAIRLSMM